MRQRFIAGIDLGASNVRIVLADESGEIAARRESPFRGTDTPEDALRAMRRTIDDLARSVWSSARVAAIGIALPGSVDPARGLVATAANLPGWHDVPLGDLLGGGEVPVAAENDANAAAGGEGWLGAAKGLSDFVFVAWGTGIGAGIWLDGHLHRGANFLAGEVAFFAMTPRRLHDSGSDAWLEGIVGGRKIEARAREILREQATAAALFDAARAGDERASAWLLETQENLAMAVVDIVALLDPQMVVFGGGVSMAQGEPFFAPIREMAHRATPTKTPIVLSTLGKDAQVLGAVKLALDRLRDHPPTVGP